MSYRTTAVLLAILVAVAGYMYFFGASPKETKELGDVDLQVLSLDERTIDTVEIREAGLVVVVKRNDDDKWQLVEPEQFEGDQARIDNVVSSIARLTASKLVTSSPDDLASYGLSSPEAEAFIGTRGGDRVQIMIGAQNPAQTGSYVKKDGSDAVYLVGSYVVTQLRGLLSEPPKAKPTPTPTPTATN